MSKVVAFVTGASRGIGRAIALRLAKDGFNVAVNDVQRAKADLEAVRQEIASRGRNAFAITGDVSVETEVKSMISEVAERLGSLDVMVANAGVCLPRPFMDISVEDWDRTLAVNGRGVFLCYKYAAQQMIKQGHGGRIIGASSVAGKQGETLLGSYSASKFAVRGLTQVAARELGAHGITVNAYSPGAIDTDMLRDLGDKAGGVEGFYKDEAGKSATGYIGTPEDVANVVSFLASGESHFVTGQSISVNGGRYFD